MELEAVHNNIQNALIKALSYGLPLVPKPYKVIADKLGCKEDEVIVGIKALLNKSDIKRFGVVVRHQKLGYKANAMVVWDTPNDMVDEFGLKFSQYPFVTLCYQRSRHLPQWRYNLFSMIHGKDRGEVLKHIEKIIFENKIESINFDVLFSTHCFKQRGAIYDINANNAK